MRFLLRIAIFSCIAVTFCIVIFLLVRFEREHSMENGKKLFHNYIFPEDFPNGEYMEMDDRVLNQINYLPKKLREHPVVIYTTQRDAALSIGYKEFHDKGCVVSNCFITHSERHKATADVLYISPEDVIDLTSRSSDQLIVLRLLESPVNTPPLKHLNNLVNYTASYRWDSDIVIPYGKWVSNGKKQIEKKMDTQELIGKTKRVAWFVSNCLTGNVRMEYALQLGQHIQVDIFGECGHRSLAASEADLLLRRDYKFYLAFENSNCEHYVTEKLFRNALENNVLPIVGGTSKEFYEKIAPPHSFIHVDDFQSPQQLSRYLLYLDKNLTAYAEYFQWKSQGSLIDTKFYCRLCAIAQDPQRKFYGNIEKWWHRVGGCSSKKIAQ